MGLFSKSEKPEIVRVKYMGVRNGEETEMLSTVNFPVYSFLVEYSDGHRELREYGTYNKREVKELNSILQYLDM